MIINNIDDAKWITQTPVEALWRRQSIAPLRHRNASVRKRCDTDNGAISRKRNQNIQHYYRLSVETFKVIACESRLVAFCSMSALGNASSSTQLPVGVQYTLHG